MTKNIRLFALSLAVMAFSVTGIMAATVSGESQKTLEKQIQTKILTMPYYGVFDSIAFQIDGGTVILSGKVYNGINRKTAQSRVSRLKGVTEVINNIEILPPSNFDDRIRRATVRGLLNTGGIYRFLIGPTPSMRIIVDNGHLTLEGNVATKGDVRIAYIVARGVPGVFSVTNNLKVSNSKKL